MPTRLHPGFDAFYKMSRDELLYWICNECWVNVPTKSSLLWMRWNLECKKHEVISALVCDRMSAYVKLPDGEKSYAKWRSITKDSDREKKQWKKCEQILSEYKVAREEECNNNG